MIAIFNSNASKGEIAQVYFPVNFANFWVILEITRL